MKRFALALLLIAAPAATASAIEVEPPKETRMDTVTANTLLSERLGWTLDELGVDRMQDAEEAIRSFQSRELDLEPDGRMGRASYARWLDRQYAELAGGCARGAIARNRAARAFLEDIVDPPTAGAEHARSRDWIQRFIREGLSWPAEAREYSHDGAKGSIKWCGSFAAWSWGHAGLAEYVRRFFVASTKRLEALALGLSFNEHAAPAAVGVRSRLVARFDDLSLPGDVPPTEPGDVLLMGPASGPDDGDHIGFVDYFDGDHFVTFEGNARGRGPRGNVREGVIRARRPVGLDAGAPRNTKIARMVIRFDRRSDFAT